MWQEAIVALLVLVAAVYAARTLGPRRWRRRPAVAAGAAGAMGVAGAMGASGAAGAASGGQAASAGSGVAGNPGGCGCGPDGKGCH